MIIANNFFHPLSVNEMTDLLLNYALKFPVDAVMPATAEATGQWVVKQWTSSPWSASQPVSQAAATGAAHSSLSMGHWGLHLAARSRAYRTHAGLFNAFVYFIGLADFVFFLTRRSRELFCCSFSFRNFHLWFANMGSSCGFSRGNIVVVVVLLLLLDGKVHHQLYC